MPGTVSGRQQGQSEPAARHGNTGCPFLAARHGQPPAAAWICFTAGYRARFEGYGGANFLANASDSYLLTRFRLGALIRPSAWFRVYAELQDTDAFLKNPPLIPPYQETWDLRRAYVDFGDIEAGPVALRVGRLDLNFGDGLLIGTSYWRNASRGYDAVQAVANASWIKATAFAASPVTLHENGLSHHQPGNNIYGLDAKLPTAVPGAVIEPFFFWRVAPRLSTEEGSSAKLDQETLGAPVVGPDWPRGGLRDGGRRPIWKARRRHDPCLGVDGQRRLYVHRVWP